MDNETNLKRQKRVPVARRLEMIEEFRQSGLTRREFAQQYDVARSTLDYWIKKTKPESNLPAPIVFSEIKFPDASMPADRGWALEIISHSGVIIRCRKTLPTSDLIRVLTEA